jgi:hypothetical protein
MPLAFHVTLRTHDRRVLTPSVGQRRTLAAAVHEIAGRSGLLAFGSSGTHLHLLLVTDRREAGKAAQALSCALHARLALQDRFSPARFEAVNDQFDLEMTFDDILRQDERRECRCDPWHDASVLPDLLGLRVLGGEAAIRVWEYLPEVDHRYLVTLLGVKALRVGTDPSLATEAAAAAIARPDLAGKTPVAVAARRALLAFLDDLGAPHSLDRHTVWRMRREPADPRLVRTIALQVGLREDLRARQRAEEAGWRDPRPLGNHPPEVETLRLIGP